MACNYFKCNDCNFLLLPIGNCKRRFCRALLFRFRVCVCVCVRCIFVSDRVRKRVLYLSIDFVCFLFHLPTCCVLALKSRRHCCIIFYCFFPHLICERDRERDCTLRIPCMCLLNSCNCATLANILLWEAEHQHYNVCYQSSAYSTTPPHHPSLPSIATLSADLQPIIYFYHNNSLRY